MKEAERTIKEYVLSTGKKLSIRFEAVFDPQLYKWMLYVNETMLGRYETWEKILRDYGLICKVDREG